MRKYQCPYCYTIITSEKLSTNHRCGKNGKHRNMIPMERPKILIIAVDEYTTNVDTNKIYTGRSKKKN